MRSTSLRYASTQMRTLGRTLGRAFRLPKFCHSFMFWIGFVGLDRSRCETARYETCQSLQIASAHVGLRQDRTFAREFTGRELPAKLVNRELSAFGWSLGTSGLGFGECQVECSQYVPTDICLTNCGRDLGSASLWAYRGPAMTMVVDSNGDDLV